jgi:hypothetical protein
MLKIQSFENLPKKFLIFIAKFSLITIFTTEKDFWKIKYLFVNQVSNLKRYYNSCDPWQKYVV